jgi:hypothetical protein
MLFRLSPEILRGFDLDALKNLRRASSVLSSKAQRSINYQRFGLDHEILELCWQRLGITSAK